MIHFPSTPALLCCFIAALSHIILQLEPTTSIMNPHKLPQVSGSIFPLCLHHDDQTIIILSHLIPSHLFSPEKKTQSRKIPQSPHITTPTRSIL
jgi:hypothetical protein